ncbi:class I adenylate-forming enzyme family protein, partial [Streptomyces sp. NPDC052644]
EAALIGHDWVADVGVVGVPDPEFGEVPQAHVVLTDTAPDPDTAVAQLRRYLTERLAKPKRPQSYVVRDALPRDPNGKLYKARLVPAEEASA